MKINIELNPLEKALVIATHYHHGQVRKNNGEPYINHPLRVMDSIRTNNFTATHCLVAALLHDIVEDTEYTIEQVQLDFGSKVARIVSILTKPKDYTGTYFDFIQSIIDSGNLSAMIIKFYNAHDNSMWIEDGKEPVPVERYQKVKQMLKQPIYNLGYRYVIEHLFLDNNAVNL